MSLLRKALFMLISIITLVNTCNAYTYRICNADPSATINGYLNLWACSDSGTDFSVAPGSSTDIDTGGCCLKDVYFDTNPVGSPVCSYENDDNCTYQRNSGCSSMTIVVARDDNGNWTLESAEGTLDCQTAAANAASCSS